MIGELSKVGLASCSRGLDCRRIVTESLLKADRFLTED